MPNTMVWDGVERMKAIVERKDNNCFSEKGMTVVSCGNWCAAIIVLLSPESRKSVVDIHTDNERNNPKIRRKIGNRIDQAKHSRNETSIGYIPFA